MSFIRTNVGELLKLLDNKRWLWRFKRSSFIDCCKKKGHAIESPLIKIQKTDGKEFVWVLRFYPKGLSEDEQGESSVQLVSLNNSPVWVRFGFDARGGIYDTGPRGELFVCWGCERGQTYTNMYPFCYGALDYELSIFFNINDVWCESDQKIYHGIYSDRCNPKQNISSIAANDNNRGVVETGITGKTRESSAKSRSQTNDDESESRQDDVSLKFIQNPKFGDIQIEVQGKKFQAHRILLSSQSKVFAEILGDDQTHEKSVSIDDISDRVFVEILRFVYFKEVRGIENNAEDFFTTAVEYSMHSFKKICEKTLSKNVTTDNAIEYLELADHFELEELRNHSVEFVASNFTTIAKISSISSLKNMKNDSLFGLIQAMATKMSEM